MGFELLVGNPTTHAWYSVNKCKENMGVLMFPGLVTYVFMQASSCAAPIRTTQHIDLSVAYYQLNL